MTGGVRRGLLVALAPLLLVSPARGQAPSGLAPAPSERIVMRLDFSGVPGCSDPEPYVVSLLPLVRGWDPLAPGGRWRMVLTVRKRPDGYEGTTELHRPEGGVEWTRSFPPKPTCFLLLDRLAYVTAHRIDPVGAPPPAAPPSKPPEPAAPAPPPPEPPKPPEPPPVTPEPAKPVEPPAAPLPGRLVPRVGVGGRGDFGGAWGAIFGVTVEGGVQRQQWRWGGWSLMGSLRWAPKQTGIGLPTATTAVDIGTLLVAGSLAGCVHRAWPVSLAGCLVAELGEVQQSAATPTLPFSHQTALFAGGGVAARIEAPLYERLYFHVDADARGVAKLAGSTNQWVNVIARSFGGAVGGLDAGLGVSF
jgi:hypothetical protein